MIYEFECTLCGAKKDISIPTYDLHDRTRHSLGIDQDKLMKRLLEPRECACGGKLKRSYGLDYDKPLFAKVDRQRFL